MMRVALAPFIAGAFLLLLTTGLGAGQWPQFRGPGGQGVSDSAQAPVEWSETSNVAWKVPVPRPRLVVAGGGRRPRVADHRH